MVQVLLLLHPREGNYLLVRCLFSYICSILSLSNTGKARVVPITLLPFQWHLHNGALNNRAWVFLAQEKWERWVTVTTLALYNRRYRILWFYSLLQEIKRPNLKCKNMCWWEQKRDNLGSTRVAPGISYESRGPTQPKNKTNGGGEEGGREGTLSTLSKTTRQSLGTCIK